MNLSQQLLECELNISRLMGVSLLYFYREGGLCWKWKRCLSKFDSTQKDTGMAAERVSVLEESHVVSESGQLLLIWNQ